ncbi:cytochrome P450 4V2-like isoform X2 [Centruroides vittatus]|uniref:cytochrome P450 4V2-like isoform X2 n=1 Tax=Centruroides vittatus TaxID=120091 RepID=UPI00351023A3
MLSETYYVTFGTFFLILLVSIWYKNFWREIIDWKRIKAYGYSWVLYFHILKTIRDVPFVMPAIIHRFKSRGFIYGNVFSQKFVLLYHPRPLEKLLSDSENIDRPLVQKLVRGIGENSLMFRNGEGWKMRKGALSRTFHQSILEKCIPQIERHSKILAEKLNAASYQWISFNQIIDSFSLKLLSAIYGVSNTSWEKNYHGVDRLINSIKTSIFYGFVKMALWSEVIFLLTGKGRSFSRDKSLARRITKEAVNERIRQIKEDGRHYLELGITVPIIDHLWETSANNPDITVDGIVDEIMTFLAAGSHSLASAVCWSVYEIGKRPDVQKRIHQELDAVFENTERRINKNDLQSLTYLECVINEVLRLYPSVPFTIRGSHENLQLGKEIFSENTVYLVSIFHLHRNPEVFPRPRTFDPDRFRPENSKCRSRYSFLPFLAGVRHCIANRYSMMEMKIFLATLLRNFTIETFPKEILPKMFHISLTTAEPVLIKVCPRIKRR